MGRGDGRRRRRGGRVPRLHAGTLECRHGPIVAILVTGTFFGFAHCTYPEVGVVLLPFDLAVWAFVALANVAPTEDGDGEGGTAPSTAT